MKVLPRSLWQRMRAIPATHTLLDAPAWSYADGTLTIDLARSPELGRPYGAVRVEADELPARVLVFQGGDGFFYAFRNQCAHGGHRLDPVPGSVTVQCCSLGHSTFDYQGQRIEGPAPRCVHTYPVSVEDGTLVIDLRPMFTARTPSGHRRAEDPRTGRSKPQAPMSPRV